jgi:CRP-like cAMP-binding protein
MPHTAYAVALHRLSKLTQLGDAAVRALHKAGQRCRIIPAQNELFAEGKALGDPQLILSGWAARVRILPDGGRQILGLLLPGDLIGHCYQPQPVALSSVIALTELMTCKAPAPEPHDSLHCAYAMSHAFDEAYLLAQITRLGRMDACDRLADLFLELLERLALAGLAPGYTFHHPLTQEMVADMTGLTTVHVNRTLKTMRRGGDANWSSGQLTLINPVALARRIGRTQTRVTQTRPRVTAQNENQVDLG